MWENLLYIEDSQIGYDEKGFSKGTMRYEDELPEPPRLKWDFNKKVIELTKWCVFFWNENVLIKLFNLRLKLL